MVRKVRGLNVRISASDTFDLHSLLLLYGPVLCYKWRCWECQNIRGPDCWHTDSLEMLLQSVSAPPTAVFLGPSLVLRELVYRGSNCSCVTNPLNIMIVRRRIVRVIFISGLSHIFKSLFVLILIFFWQWQTWACWSWWNNVSRQKPFEN